MKVVVCGCSWSSECHIYPNTGYGTYLTQSLGAEYVNIARPSASNYVIRAQIDYAVNNLNPDLVVVSWTTPERFTWKYNQEDYYSPETALQQITYYDTPDRTNSTHPVPGMEPCVASESWASLFGIFDHDMSEIDNITEPNADIGKNVLTTDQFNILKKYFLHFVDIDLLRHEQYYLIESASAQLQRHGVPFLMARPWREDNGVYSTWPIIPKDNFVDSHPSDYAVRSVDGDQPVHHLHPKDQRNFALRELLPKAKVLISKS